MATYTIVRSRASIALAILFTVGTAAVLFWDIRHLADITTDHLMTALVLIGTLASGHMVMPQLKAFRLIPAGGLALLFVGGTFYCVTTSAARNVETGVPKLLERLNLNEQRAALERDILEAKADLTRAKAAAERECGSGAGPLCKGRMKTQEQADSHYWMLVGRLATMKPAQPANPGLAHAAKVFAILPLTGTPEAIEQALVLLFPFAKALFLEIATLVFWGIGLGHGRKDLPEAKPTRTKPEPKPITVRPVSSPPQFADRTEPKRKVEAQKDLLVYIDLAGAAPSQDFLRERWGLRSKSTVSEWLAEWEERGLITRERDGKCKTVRRFGSRTVMN